MTTNDEADPLTFQTASDVEGQSASNAVAVVSVLRGNGSHTYQFSVNGLELSAPVAFTGNIGLQQRPLLPPSTLTLP